eukprot:334418-Prymnesium_polylepis.1
MRLRPVTNNICGCRRRIMTAYRRRGCELKGKRVCKQRGCSKRSQATTLTSDVPKDDGRRPSHGQRAYEPPRAGHAELRT